MCKRSSTIVVSVVKSCFDTLYFTEGSGLAFVCLEARVCYQLQAVGLNLHYEAFDAPLIIDLAFLLSAYETFNFSTQVYCACTYAV